MDWNIYSHNLYRIVVSKSVCHFQSLLPLSTAYRQGQEPNLRVESLNGLHLGKLQPCLQIFVWDGNDWQWPIWCITLQK